MKAKIAALIFIGSIMLARADQMIESVQQALKDQGFYYGEITGQTNANLTAAIRRYQIRNGLQVNGELNRETLQSLGINSSASAQPAAKPAAPSSPDTTRNFCRDQDSPAWVIRVVSEILLCLRRRSSTSFPTTTGGSRRACSRLPTS